MITCKTLSPLEMSTSCRVGGNFTTSLPCKILGANAQRIPSRPGILCLINDADWELEGEETYELQSGDNVLFVSTLHGG